MKIELFNQLPKDVILYISTYLRDYVVYRHGKMMFKFEKHLIEHIKKLISSIPEHLFMPTEFTVENNFVSILKIKKVIDEGKPGVAQITQHTSLYRVFHRKTKVEHYKYVSEKRYNYLSLNRTIDYAGTNTATILNFSINEMGIITIEDKD